MMSFYDPLHHDGKMLYGAAAMNVRVKQLGGADNFANSVARKAVKLALQELCSPQENISEQHNSSNVIKFKPKKAA